MYPEINSLINAYNDAKRTMIEKLHTTFISRTAKKTRAIWNFTFYFRVLYSVQRFINARAIMLTSIEKSSEERGKFIQCRFNAGPTSQTSVQRLTNLTPLVSCACVLRIYM